MPRNRHTRNKVLRVAFDAGYTVSDDGTVVTRPDGNTAGIYRSGGYLKFCLMSQHDCLECTVHSLQAAQVFGLDSTIEAEAIRHWPDTDRTNNHRNNIQLGSNSDNQIDDVLLGNKNTKVYELEYEQILNLRKEWADNKSSYPSRRQFKLHWAQEYGVSPGVIGRAEAGKGAYARIGK